MKRFTSGIRAAQAGLFVNAALVVAKLAAGIAGHSYALIADAVESSTDIFASLIVWGGLHVSAQPADDSHPYGHGKAEALATAAVALMLIGAAIGITLAAIREILLPDQTPLPFTLIVLAGVVIIKEVLFRRAAKTGATLDSAVLRADAWHHRSDALTSAAALVGIIISLVGGPGFETADDWAALVACGIIAWNGMRLLRGTLDEIMDAAVSPDIVREVRKLAASVDGVMEIEKCRIRKSGLHLALDIHVVVDAELTVRRGHVIAHEVEAKLRSSAHRINDVTVHIEPDRD